jgi:predicted DNA-binding protein
MATKNTRISVMLKPEVAEILFRLSKLTKQSQSSIIGEIIEVTSPTFERMIILLEAAKSASANVLVDAKASLEDAEKKALDLLGISETLFDRTEAAFNLPPHVTRGSHLPKSAAIASTSPMKTGDLHENLFSPDLQIQNHTNNVKKSSKSKSKKDLSLKNDLKASTSVLKVKKGQST